MKKYYILSLLLPLFIGCSKPKYEGFSSKEEGVYYQMHIIGDGERLPNEDDYIISNIQLTTFNDSVFYSSEWKHTFGFESVSLKENILWTPILSMLQAGDSATFIIENTKNKYSELVNHHFDFPDVFKLNIKVNEVFYEDEYKKWSDEMYWLHDQEMNEQILLLKKLDSLEFTSSNYVNGIYFKEINRGKGPYPLNGDVVTVHYKGYFMDGKIFDSTYGINEPMVFNMGDPDQVIVGLENGISMMKKNGKAKLIIPSQLAFGDKGSSSGIIPPFTTVIYEVELVSIN
jgi:FKBP-type peptidyl-prolyl cis-trans isomerase FkpA